MTRAKNKPNTFDETVSFPNVYVKKETEKALLCIIEGEEHWIPKSQVSSGDTEVGCEGDRGTLVISKWIAETKELV